MVVTQIKEYNILLLGQTGTGKSTFINSFCNYASFATLDAALDASTGTYCIPTIFDWYHDDDDNDNTSGIDEGNPSRIQVGARNAEGESQKIGESATQRVRSHLFNFGATAIRFIDTPGFGDTKGLSEDERICEDLLQFLSVRNDLQALHGVIFLFKSNDNRMTTFFAYCLDQIFSKLHKDAYSNITFVFTHTKGTHYKPGPTLQLLKKVINEKNLEVDCSKENIFCVENDCIKFLLAYFYNQDNLTFSEETKDLYRIPWQKSSSECVRLIKYIKSLQPHSVEDTVRINKFLSYSGKLQEELHTISNIICEKMQKQKELGDDIISALNDIKKLQEVLFTRNVTVRADGYHLICNNPRCSEKKKHSENKQACCPGCTAWTLRLCKKIKRGSCTVCGCTSLDHVYEKNVTEVKMEKEENIALNIDDKQKINNTARLELFHQKILIKKYQAERKYIESCGEKLLKFLATNYLPSNQGKPDGSSSNSVDVSSVSISIQEVNDMLDILPNLEMVGKDVRRIFDNTEVRIPEEMAYFINDIPENWMEAFKVTI